MVRVMVPANIILTIPNLNKDSKDFEDKLKEAILLSEIALNEINYVDTDRKVCFRVHITSIPSEVV